MFHKLDIRIKTRSTNPMLAVGPARHTMAFEYAWLKILQVLLRAKRPMAVEELRGTLQRAGFRFEGQGLEGGLGRLQAQELVEVLVLAGADGQIGSVAITAKGERKVRSIVRF